MQGSRGYNFFIMRICIVTAMTMLLFVSSAGNTVAETARFGRVLDVKGIVETKNGKQPWLKTKPGLLLYEGIFIRTQAGSSALIELEGTSGMSQLEVKENSQLRLAQMVEDRDAGSQNTLIDLALGKLLIQAETLNSDKSSFEVKTPTSLIGVRGTSFAVTVEAAK
jgi:hypothetical protein